MKFFDLLIGVLTGGAVFLVAMLLFSAFGWVDYLDPMATSGTIGMVILSFALAIIFGVLVGWFLKKTAITFGVLALGVIIGFSLGAMCYNTFFMATHNVWLMIGCIVIGVIVFGYLASKYNEHIRIYGTAFIGSYCFIRGISLFCGHYPSEVEMYAQINNGMKPEFEWEFYIYLAAIVFMFVLGFKYQFKQKEPEDGEKGDHYKKF